MNDATKKRLLDALLACRAIRGFVAGIDFAAYERSLLIRSGVERQIAIVGEALGAADRGDPELREHMPGMGQIIGLRNRIIHGYDSLDDEVIWDVVVTKLPPLQTLLESLLDENEGKPDTPARG
jgi:uncharacterized protein with HEPN domain